MEEFHWAHLCGTMVPSAAYLTGCRLFSLNLSFFDSWDSRRIVGSWHRQIIKVVKTEKNKKQKKAKKNKNKKRVEEYGSVGPTTLRWCGFHMNPFIFYFLFDIKSLV